MTPTHIIALLVTVSGAAFYAARLHYERKLRRMREEWDKLDGSLAASMEAITDQIRE